MKLKPKQTSSARIRPLQGHAFPQNLESLYAIYAVLPAVLSQFICISEAKWLLLLTKSSVTFHQKLAIATDWLGF